MFFWSREWICHRAHQITKPIQHKNTSIFLWWHRSHPKTLKQKTMQDSWEIAWPNGKKKTLTHSWKDAREIQSRAFKQKSMNEVSKKKAFIGTRLVLQGEIFQALKHIDHDSNTKGVHSISPQVSEKLKSKHPSGQAANDDILLNITKDAPKQVIFEEISVELVQSVTTNIVTRIRRSHQSWFRLFQTV